MAELEGNGRRQEEEPEVRPIFRVGVGPFEAPAGEPAVMLDLLFEDGERVAGSMSVA